MSFHLMFWFELIMIEILLLGRELLILCNFDICVTDVISGSSLPSYLKFAEFIRVCRVTTSYSEFALGFDLTILHTFSKNTPWKLNNLDSKGVRLNPLNPLWIRHCLKWYSLTTFPLCK